MIILSVIYICIGIWFYLKFAWCIGMPNSSIKTVLDRLKATSLYLSMILFWWVWIIWILIDFLYNALTRRF